MTVPLVDVLASGFNLFAVIMQEKIVFKDICESPVKWGAFEGTSTYRVEATNLRTHFKEYPDVFQNSQLYPWNSCTS